MDPLDALPEAVLALDEQRVVTACNDRCGPLLGVTTEDLGRPLGEAVTLLDEDGQVCHDPLPDRGVADRVAERLLRVRLDDGRERPVAMAGRWQPGGGVVLSFRSAGRREAVDAARSDLVATVSHEIRSPLTSVKGFTRTLLLKWDRYSDEQKLTFLETINEDADRVTRLLEELLDVSRIDANRVQLHVSGTDVARIAADVADKARQRPDGEGRDIEVEVGDRVPKLVFADPDKIEQVLTNLVDNALRYAPGSQVRIRVMPWDGAGGQDGDRGVQVDVEDHGPGIGPEHQRTIFHKFGRGRESRRAGTGLGLYITRGLARAHGGDVTVRTGQGEGARFTLTLPPGDVPG